MTSLMISDLLAALGLLKLNNEIIRSVYVNKDMFHDVICQEDI